MRRLMVYSFLTGVVLLLSLSSVVYSGTFTDTFDDPNFTNNNWMDYDTGIQQTWSFPLIGPANSGYHVSTTSSSPPAAKGANNGIEYYSTDLYIEALVRIDSHSSAYSSENIAGLAFSMTQGTGYYAAFELDFEGYNETVLQIGIVEGDRLIETPVTINFDTFYKLVVKVDANQNMHAYLYELNGTLLGNVSAANVLSIDRGGVGIFGGLEVTFDDYTLTGNPVDQAGTLSQTQISQLYVSIFGRASEGEGNAYWQTQSGMATAAAAMLDTDAARNYFGANLNTNQAFIEHIYLNTLNKTIADDFDGISYWVGMLDAGTSRGEAVATLVGAINDYAPDGPYYNPDDTATVAAYNQFINRVEVSNYMTDNVYATPDDWETSTSFSHGMVVTDNAATVAEAKRAVDHFKFVSPAIELSKPVVNLETGESTTIIISGGSGNFSVVNSNTHVATASISGDNLGITGLSEGNIIIVVTDDEGMSADVTVTVSTEVHKGYFIDTFDNPNFTKSNWGTASDVQQSWSFPTLNGVDLGYQVNTTTTTTPAAKTANNGELYNIAGLHIETFIRIDNHPNAYKYENHAGLFFAMTGNTGYSVGIQLDFDGPIAIDMHIGIIGGSDVMKTPVSIEFDTFYKMVVEIDLNKNINAYLYELDGTLVGNVFSSDILSLDSGIVGIWGSPIITFDDFKLTGNPL